MTVLFAPFTPEQVVSLNKDQQNPKFHGYTCGSGNRKDANHTDGVGLLVASEQGWSCPFCKYRQFWAVEPVKSK